MIVIVIIGIMAALVVVSVTLGDPRRELLKEAERLRAVLAMAAEEAVIQQAELGAEFTDTGYRFLKWELPDESGSLGGSDDPGLSGTSSLGSGGGLETQSASESRTRRVDPQTGEELPPEPEWQVLETDEALRTYELPEGMRMRVEVDYEQVDIKERPSEKSKLTENKPTPNILFMSSGETSPYRIELFLVEDGRKPVFIEGSIVGQVKVLDEPPR
ncbi:putative General secretion pathway protein H [gamma proteobacterium HdN1]|nr:putative General secretion pathway protein H [gamma proteobacterium HdN1]